MKTEIKTTDEKITDVCDWGTETSGEPKKIKRGVFKTSSPNHFEVFTSPSKHSGLYSSNARSEIITRYALVDRYGDQLKINGINL